MIGNLTKDAELTVTNTGTSVCTFTVATDRSWTTEAGDKKEETEFHRVIAWQKLAEICGQMLHKGSKVYVDGRLSTKKFTNPEGLEKTVTEIVANDIIVLDPKRIVEEDAKVA